MSYNSPPQHKQHAYHDSTDFNPYSTSAPQPYPSYDQGVPYKDESVPPLPGAMTGPSHPEDNDFDPFQPPPKSTGDLRMWRQDHHGNLWTKGGRGRCIGRFCCCSIMVVILLFVSVVLTLAIFLRPPDIEFGGVQPAADSSGDTVQSSTTDLAVNLGFQISVRNPNFFTVTFKSISASITYPIRKTEIGGGQESNVVFASNSKTTFTFPFMIKYSLEKDNNGDILRDIATKCGFVPGSVKQQLTVQYTLTLSIQILGITLDPPITGNVNFDCPFTIGDIKPLIDSVPALQGILTGNSGTN